VEQKGKGQEVKVTIPGFLTTDKVTIVTGSRRGIGKATALALAEAGSDIAVCDLVADDGQLDAVAEEIRGFGRRSLSIKADVSRAADVELLVEKVMGEFGRIDILVNNAGILIKSPILDMPEADWDRLINANLKGCYLCAQAVGRIMVRQESGTIINIASQYAFRVTPNMGGYSIAKAGVAMLTRVLARELGAYGIRANAVAPGLARTEFSKLSWSDPEFMKQYEASVPLGRIAETGDLTGVILFLASDASRYVTGHTILVDGGALA
jgi:NAD(P)-dependent dehydrogenase (short-subunit alcohol dehydrogenase family)